MKAGKSKYRFWKMGKKVKAYYKKQTSKQERKINKKEQHE